MYYPIYEGSGGGGIDSTGKSGAGGGVIYIHTLKMLKNYGNITADGIFNF